jgi:hypothetical protein
MRYIGTLILTKKAYLVYGIKQMLFVMKLERRKKLRCIVVDIQERFCASILRIRP